MPSKQRMFTVMITESGTVPRSYGVTASNHLDAVEQVYRKMEHDYAIDPEEVRRRMIAKKKENDALRQMSERLYVSKPVSATDSAADTI